MPAYLQSAMKDTTRLKDFLNNLTLHFIKSNNFLNQGLPPLIRLVKAPGDTKIILDVVFKRVDLFKKFVSEPACHAQLFHEPLSTLIGSNDLPKCNSTEEMETFFANNNLFLDTVLNMLQMASSITQLGWLKKVCVLQMQKISNSLQKCFSQISPLSRTHSLFLSDMLRLVEKRIFPQGLLTTVSCCLRLRYNIHMFFNKPTVYHRFVV
jgi:hypothetical protein